MGIKKTIGGVLVLLMLFAGGGGYLWSAIPVDAAGIHNGYHYERLICQEYGHQPKWTWVRTPQEGSDWRNDGGWAIVLERGAHFRNIEAEYSFTNSLRQGKSNGNAQATVNAAFADTDKLSGNVIKLPEENLRQGDLLRAQDGSQGWVAGFGAVVIIDQNGDGQFTTADLRRGDGTDTTNPKLGTWGGGAVAFWYWEERTWTRTAASSYENYGTTVVRWANMAWCR